MNGVALSLCYERMVIALPMPGRSVIWVWKIIFTSLTTLRRIVSILERQVRARDVTRSQIGSREPEGGRELEWEPGARKEPNRSNGGRDAKTEASLTECSRYEHSLGSSSKSTGLVRSIGGGKIWHPDHPFSPRRFLPGD